MPGRAQTGQSDAVVRPAARRAGDRGRAAARLAQRSRRACLGDRRRSDRGRACQGDHVHGLRHGRLEARRTGAAEEGEPRARQLDAGERILAWIEEARSSGARVLTGGDTDGELIRPTVIADAGPELRVNCEEVFGPVCTVTSVGTIDEALELANGTRYGLQAGIFTGGLETALRAAQELEFGGVTVNEAPTFRADQMPYGGVKDSGNTREGPAYAVRELTEEHLVVIAL